LGRSTRAASQHRGRIRDVVQHVADEHRLERAVGKRQRAAVGDGEGRAGHGFAGERHLWLEQIDADAGPARRQAGEVAALAAADFEKGRPNRRGKRRQQGVLGLRETGSGGQELEAFPVGEVEVLALDVAEASVAAGQRST